MIHYKFYHWENYLKDILCNLVNNHLFVQPKRIINNPFEGCWFGYKPELL